jgi:hypothetical protein
MTQTQCSSSSSTREKRKLEVELEVSELLGVNRVDDFHQISMCISFCPTCLGKARSLSSGIVLMCQYICSGPCRISRSECRCYIAAYLYDMV